VNSIYIHSNLLLIRIHLRIFSFIFNLKKEITQVCNAPFYLKIATAWVMPFCYKFILKSAMKNWVIMISSSTRAKRSSIGGGVWFRCSPSMIDWLA
jgi:hypothetical protein